MGFLFTNLELGSSILQDSGGKTGLELWVNLLLGQILLCGLNGIDMY
jgi:hypothetical protein